MKMIFLKQLMRASLFVFLIVSLGSCNFMGQGSSDGGAVIIGEKHSFKLSEKLDTMIFEVDLQAGATYSFIVDYGDTSSWDIDMKLIDSSGTEIVMQWDNLAEHEWLFVEEDVRAQLIFEYSGYTEIDISFMFDFLELAEIPLNEYFEDEIIEESFTKRYYVYLEEGQTYAVRLSSNFDQKFGHDHSGDPITELTSLQHYDNSVSIYSGNYYQPDGFTAKDSGYHKVEFTTLSSSHIGDFGFSLQEVSSETLVAPETITLEILGDPGKERLGIDWVGVDDALGYRVMVSQDGGVSYKIGGTVPGDRSYFTYYDLKPAVDYRFIVQGYWNDTLGSESAPGSFSIDVADFIMGEPEASYELEDLVITWDELNGAEAYRLYRSEESNSSFTQVGGDLSASTLEYQDNTAEIETAYYYKISAVIDGVETKLSPSNLGKRQKYGPDLYEDDDENPEYPNLYSSNIGLDGLTQNRTIDYYDVIDSWRGDYFTYRHNSYTPYKLKISFPELDLNGRENIELVVGYTTYDISTAGESFTTEDFFHDGDEFDFRITAGSEAHNYKTASYTVHFELVQN